MFERELRDLSHVPRWAISRLHHKQNVAEHSFYVIHYCFDIAKLIGWPQYVDNFGEDMAKLAYAAAWHDVDESFTGDIIGPVKRSIKDPAKYDAFIKRNMEDRFPGWMEIDDPEIKAIIKAADLIEECMFLGDEIQMGNGALSGFYNNAWERLKEAWKRLPAEENVLTETFEIVQDAVMFGPKRQSLTPSNSDDLAS